MQSVVLSLRRLQQHFEINQRSEPVDGTANLAEAAFSIEFTGASLYVVGIQADGIAGPFHGNLPCFVDTLPTDSIALLIRMNRHSSEVQRLLAGIEVLLVDSPGFASRKRERCDRPSSMSGYEHGGSSHREEHTLFGRARCPVARAVFGDQLLINRDSERYKVRCVTSCSALQSDAHSISIVHHWLPC